MLHGGRHVQVGVCECFEYWQANQAMASNRISRLITVNSRLLSCRSSRLVSLIEVLRRLDSYVKVLRG